MTYYVIYYIYLAHLSSDNEWAMLIVLDFNNAKIDIYYGVSECFELYLRYIPPLINTFM